MKFSYLIYRTPLNLFTDSIRNAKILTFSLPITASYRILPHFTDSYGFLPIFTASYRNLLIGGPFAVR